MFKRITKKVKRKERDEELGLDEEAKQVLGLQDTDSDESETDSDANSDLGSDSDSDASEDSDFDAGSDVGMKTEWLGAEGYGSDEDEGSDDDSLDLDFDGDEDTPMTLVQATKKPIYLKSSDPDIHACIVCPTKALKNQKMVDVHLQSSAHKRHFTKFCEVAQLQKNRDKDPRRIVASIAKATSGSAKKTDGLSNRALKRKKKLEQLKKKRSIQKEIVAKKKRRREKKLAGEGGDPDAPAESGDESSRQPKKRKLDGGEAPEGNDSGGAAKSTKKGKVPSNSNGKSAKASSPPKKEKRPKPLTPQNGENTSIQKPQSIAPLEDKVKLKKKKSRESIQISEKLEKNIIKKAKRKSGATKGPVLID